MAHAKNFNIRPSQVTRTFGPGSIYDNQSDSMIIMGLDSWQPDKFKGISDELLLQEIRRNKFDSVEKLYSTSSFADADDPGTIPVRSFPTWGFCPKCKKLVPNRNYQRETGMKCDSAECKDRKKNKDIELPKTYPVRFVATCKNGHLDEFPWYRWVHRNKNEMDACSENDAKLYLVDNSKTMSLEGKRVECKNCDAASQEMRTALSKNGLKSAGIFGCTRKRPWLKDKEGSCTDSEGESEQMRGIFKGSSSIYFPLVRSSVTIPPFSDELAQEINRNKAEIYTMKKMGDVDFFEKYLVGKFKLKSEKFPDGTYTLEETLGRIKEIEDFAKKNKDKDVKELEFQELNKPRDTKDKEFVTENCDDIPREYADCIDRIVLVKKTRVVSAITGFTRMDAYDPKEHSKVSSLAKSNPRWLPALENRGEGIFFSFNNRALNEWKKRNDVKERFGRIMTVQRKIKTDPEDYKHDPKYVFLHTFSHTVMRSLAKLAGYSTASFTERIYCGDGMAGIFIYTSSSSSDGSLGGLVDVGRKGDERIGDVLANAVLESGSCPCDPHCSMQQPEKVQGFAGAACHACALLPETCCENMNTLLDREMIDHTLGGSLGFFDFARKRSAKKA